MPNSLPVSSAAERNKDPILAVLRRVLPARGHVVEIASGTGQHVVHFAAALPELSWQPTEYDPARRAVIAARLAAAPLANVRPPASLDVHADPWPLAERADAVLCINMIHIAPPSATEALLRGARRQLRDDAPGVLVLYGPFREQGRHSAASNAAFDAALRADNPDWGVRDLGELTQRAHDLGYAADPVVRMPANNLIVVLRHGAGAPA